MRASIDIGSNTILLLAGSFSNDGFNEAISESRVTSLGKGLDRTGKFDPTSIEDSKQAFKEYVKILKKVDIKPSEVIVTATEASRVASNSDELLGFVEKKYGFKVQIISGEGEAYYTSLGVVKGSKIASDSAIIMDIGGASTEFIRVRTNPFSIKETISLPMGSVRATDWLQEGIYDQKFEAIKEKFDIDSFKTEHLICVAGSMTALGGMIKGLTSFDKDEIQGAKISMSEFDNFLKSILKCDAEELKKQYPFLGKRAPYIQGGAIVGKTLADILGVKTFEISTLGLRYGTIFSGGIDERFVR
ncbi:hypothetical protein OAT67_07855 [Bacteriovoracaceae bacterium]|nr:hypothetical protein [Bacteriovoracaceae bacterium]|tara:strand:+ start:614 stop:1522 length:909 start_codon:yes stop_codon:yes gene_type:complete